MRKGITNDMFKQLEEISIKLDKSLNKINEQSLIIYELRLEIERYEVVTMVIKNLKSSREDLDLKQKDISKKLNIHFSTFSGWETGKDTIPLRTINKIC